MSVNHKNTFSHKRFSLHKHIFTICLILMVPVASFLSFLFIAFRDSPISRNNILGASTQLVNGNTNSSYINAAGYNIVNNVIYKNGSPIVLHGVNWFGFETDWHVFHGLDRRNYGSFMDQMKSIGINAVRVPLCPDSIHGTSPLYINYSANADLQNLNSIQILDKMMTAFASKGIYVLLDLHRPDCFDQSELWYTNSYSESQWLTDLKSLATRYKSNEYFIGIDLKNEPHTSATWGTGNIYTDWNSAAERAGNAVLSVNSNILIFVEGTSTSSNCTQTIYTNWGANFEPYACFPISSSQIPYNKLILSPHVYGPDVAYQSYFSDPSFPSNIPTIMNAQFGYLKDRNFYVVPGEWGGKYGNGGLASDKTWQDAFANYLISKQMCSSFYWSWNPDSGDTGGILQDDWTNLWSNKVQLLQNYYNSCKQSITTVTNSPVPIYITKPISTSIPSNTTLPSSTSTTNSTQTITPAVTANVNCICESTNLCSSNCKFNGNSSLVSCSIESASPSPSDKNDFCNRPERTRGDVDGDGEINPLDYIYYVRVVNGGTVPSKVNADFSGDGKVSTTDRQIIIENIQK